jgi:hypothetical protein
MMSVRLEKRVDKYKIIICRCNYGCIVYLTQKYFIVCETSISIEILVAIYQH